MKALLFGSIGVLVDASAAQLEAYNQAFDEVGLDWHWDEADYRRRLSMSGGRDRLRDYASTRDGEAVSEHTIARIHDIKTRRFDEALARGDVKARPGILRLVGAARDAGVRLGFVTSTEIDNVEASLAAAGLAASDFDVTTHRGNVAEDKPDPAAYRLALDHLGIAADEAVAIEDTEPCLRSAVDAGLRCIATPNSFSGDQDFGRAHAVVDHLGDEREPARLIAGENIVSDGLVTLDTLARSLSGTSA